jgi:hypothetical protein
VNLSFAAGPAARWLPRRVTITMPPSTILAMNTRCVLPPAASRPASRPVSR